MITPVSLSVWSMFRPNDAYLDLGLPLNGFGLVEYLFLGSALEIALFYVEISLSIFNNI